MQLSAQNMLHEDLDDSPRKHFNLIKTSKASFSLLDDLKKKASQYSKSRTTKTLLNNYAQNAGHVIGEDLNIMNSSMNVSAKSLPYMGRFLPSKNDSKYYFSFAAFFTETIVIFLI